MASNKQFSVGRPVIWIGVVVLSAGVAAGAWYLKSSGIETAVKAANKQAASTVKRELAPELTAADVREPMTEEASDALQEVVQEEILDEGISTVRIWTPDGTLVFSSTGEQTGTQGGNDRSIELATTDDGKTTSIEPATDGGLLDIYTPLRIGAESAVRRGGGARPAVRADRGIREPALGARAARRRGSGRDRGADDDRLVRVAPSGTVRQARGDGIRSLGRRRRR